MDPERANVRSWKSNRRSEADTFTGSELRQDGSLFLTTQWSVVLAVAGTDSAKSTDALEQLCRAYWYPLYAHVRRRGNDIEAARDLTQGFFAQLLATNSVARADARRGRFRTFLLAALDNYLHHQHRDSNALKRGGGKEFVSWDAEAAEERYTREPADRRSPELEFDKRWALTTLERVRLKLQTELSVIGKGQLFDLLRPYLSGDSDGAPYAQLAVDLKMTTVAVKVTVHRLRRRYGELLRAEVSRTLDDPEDADQEIRHLLAALGD